MRHVVPVMRRSRSGGDARQDGDEENNADNGGTAAGTYVQGMNVIAAPFLYAARSEAEAFVAFQRFLSRECPGYVRGAMDGVHRGLAVRIRSSLPVDFPDKHYHIVGRQDSGHRRSETVRLSTVQVDARRALRLSLGADPLRMHPSVTRGVASLGFPLCLRRASEHPVHRRAADHDA